MCKTEAIKFLKIEYYGFEDYIYETAVKIGNEDYFNDKIHHELFIKRVKDYFYRVKLEIKK